MKKSLLILVCFTLVFTSCKKDDDEVKTDTPQAFTSYVRDLPEFEQEVENTNNEHVEVSASEPEVNEAGTEACAVTEMMVSSSNSEFFLLDPTTDVIYPGAMLDGNTITTGEYVPIVADRAPLTFSVSLPTTNQTSPVATVDNPKLSSVRRAVNDLFNDMEIESTPAYMSLSKKQTYSKNGLSRSIGVSYGDPQKSLGGTVTFEEGEETNKVVIKFIQKYYTIDVDYPQRPSDWFMEDTPMPDASTIGEVSPVYVSSVTYGRMALITIESSESYDNIISTIDASLSAVPKEASEYSGDDVPSTEIEASFSDEQKKIFNEFKMDMLIIGGSATNAADMMSISGISDYAEKMSSFISEGAEWSPESPGVMLAYKLRHLSTNGIANVVLADSYKVRDCSRTKFIFKCEMTKWDVQTNDAGSEAEIEGAIRAEILDPQGNVVKKHTFWDRGETDIEQDDIYTDFDNPIFTYEHTATNADGDVSAEGYTLRLFGDGMKEHDGYDGFGDANPDDPLNAEALNIKLDNHQLLLNDGEEYYLKFKGDGRLFVYFNISAL